MYFFIGIFALCLGLLEICLVTVLTLASCLSLLYAIIGFDLTITYILTEKAEVFNKTMYLNNLWDMSISKALFLVVTIIVCLSGDPLKTYNLVYTWTQGLQQALWWCYRRLGSLFGLLEYPDIQEFNVYRVAVNDKVPPIDYYSLVDKEIYVNTLPDVGGDLIYAGIKGNKLFFFLTSILSGLINITLSGLVLYFIKTHYINEDGSLNFFLKKVLDTTTNDTGNVLRSSIMGSVTNKKNPKIPNVTLKDYVNSNSVLKYSIEKAIKNYQNGKAVRWFLSGAPGVGKTFLAKCIAGEMNVPLITHSGSFSRFLVGSGSSLVEDLFRKTTDEPSVLLLDEIHNNFVQDYKNSNPRNEDGNTTLASLLSALVDCENSKIFVILAGNTTAYLPPALIRQGRIDDIIDIQSPSKKDIYEYCYKEVDELQEKHQKVSKSKDTEVLSDTYDVLSDTYSQIYNWVGDLTLGILQRLTNLMLRAIKSVCLMLNIPIVVNNKLRSKETDLPKFAKHNQINVSYNSKKLLLEFYNYKNTRCTKKNVYQLPLEDVLEAYDVNTYADAKNAITKLFDSLSLVNESPDSIMKDNYTKLLCKINLYRTSQIFTEKHQYNKLDFLKSQINLKMNNDVINHPQGCAFLSEKYLTSNHELGHWIIGKLFKHCIKIQRIISNSREDSLRSENRFLGYVSYQPLIPQGNLFALISCYLSVGGSVFEYAIQKFDTWGASSDFYSIERDLLLLLSFQTDRDDDMLLTTCLTILRENKWELMTDKIKYKINKLFRLIKQEVKHVFDRPCWVSFKKEFNLNLSVKGYLSYEDQKYFEKKLYQILESENMLDSNKMFKVSKYFSLFKSLCPDRFKVKSNLA